LPYASAISARPAVFAFWASAGEIATQINVNASMTRRPLLPKKQKSGNFLLVFLLSTPPPFTQKCVAGFPNEWLGFGWISRHSYHLWCRVIAAVLYHDFHFGFSSATELHYPMKPV
jgi:hypothetical protein